MEKFQQFGSHLTNCNYNTDRINRNILKKENTFSIYKLNCDKCNEEYELSLSINDYTKGRYRKNCSRTCANSKVVTDEHKIKTSKSLLNTNSFKISSNKSCDVFFNSCTFCNILYATKKKKQTFCSKKCVINYKISTGLLKSNARKGGLKSIESQSRRSKNEIYFHELCEKYFIDVDNNKSIFNGWDADVIIHDIKTAVLWNGIWHYKKIRESHSVEKVQIRDEIKISEIIKYGYIPYVIKDMGPHNKKFVEEQFNIFLEQMNIKI